MATVVLVFHGLNDHDLAHLTQLDARTLATELLSPDSLRGKKIALRLRAAADADGEESRVVLDDREDLEAVHLTCSESIGLKGLPSFDALCAEVARMRTSPG